MISCIFSCISRCPNAHCSPSRLWSQYEGLRRNHASINTDRQLSACICKSQKSYVATVVSWNRSTPPIHSSTQTGHAEIYLSLTLPDLSFIIGTNQILISVARFVLSVTVSQNSISQIDLWQSHEEHDTWTGSHHPNDCGAHIIIELQYA